MSFSIFILATLKSLPYISGKFPFSGDIAIKELLSGGGDCLDYSHLRFPEGIWPSGIMKFMAFLGVTVYSHCNWIGIHVFVCSYSNLPGCE